MILQEALQSATQTLHRAGIADASVEAELLLGHVLGISRTRLYTEPERSLTSAEAERLRHLIGRRLAHEPTAYILGHCEFYGLDFRIDSRTFIPRPETELLVEEAVELARHISRQEEQVIIADIGTGCGAIAISLALALPQARIYATDISVSALQIAEMNCRRHAVRDHVELLQGNLLEPLPQPVDILVANLPYIKGLEFKDLSPEIIDYEPMIALAGGEDGLDKIRQMLQQTPGKVNRRAYLLLEIGQGQGEMVTSLAKGCFPQASIELVSDLGGVERLVKVGL
ncbi:MAG: protein-(glutamine-N5) methyltransferase, release factor-specific [Chloroflexi bacterium RBG_13_51_36]|nr:MAG: protein-(glutamine-N5) methyltransferase, release factor-specific [Chloroflexi bacterium RBG_13_51_36]